MSNRIPEFGEWQRYWLRDYRGPNIDHLIAFAFRMATHTRTGEMYVRTGTLAEESGLKPDAARKRRTRCAEAGIIRRTDERHNGEWVYVRSIPATATTAAGGTASPATGTASPARLQLNSDVYAGETTSSGTASPTIVRGYLELEKESGTASPTGRVVSRSDDLRPPMRNSLTDGRERDVPRGTASPAGGTDVPTCDRCGDVATPDHDCLASAFRPPCDTCGGYHDGKCKGAPVCWTCKQRHPRNRACRAVA